MTIAGLLFIVVIVLLSNRLGYAWTSERQNLNHAFHAFLVALALTTLSAFAQTQDFLRFMLFSQGTANTVGAFFLVRAAFGLGGQLDAGETGGPSDV